jgi:hypothetical protein
VVHQAGDLVQGQRGSRGNHEIVVADGFSIAQRQQLLRWVQGCGFGLHKLNVVARKHWGQGGWMSDGMRFPTATYGLDGTNVNSGLSETTVMWTLSPRM